MIASLLNGEYSTQSFNIFNNCCPIIRSSKIHPSKTYLKVNDAHGFLLVDEIEFKFIEIISFAKFRLKPSQTCWSSLQSGIIYIIFKLAYTYSVEIIDAMPLTPYGILIR